MASGIGAGFNALQMQTEIAKGEVTHLDNDASQRVAARCGFTREGILRGYERFKGARPDVMSWSLLATDPRPWHRP